MAWEQEINQVIELAELAHESAMSELAAFGFVGFEELAEPVGGLPCGTGR